jgi:hypothetical protein
MDSKPVLHGDNGSTLKATTVLAMLQWLGVKPFHQQIKQPGTYRAVGSTLRSSGLTAGREGPCRLRAE